MADALKLSFADEATVNRIADLGAEPDWRRADRHDALKRFLVEDGIGQDQRFWRLAQAFSALYPATSDEKRWVDGVLARKKGLGF